MKKFNSIEELIEAKAQQSHLNNLKSGGVFDDDDIRHSDLEFERTVAKNEGTVFVPSAAAKILGYEFSVNARVINGVGYVSI